MFNRITRRRRHKLHKARTKNRNMRTKHDFAGPWFSMDTYKNRRFSTEIRRLELELFGAL